MPAGATYEPIATTTVGSTVSEVTISSIPSTYTDLVLVCSFLTISADQSIGIRFNSDSGTNYSYTSLYGYGTAASGRSTNNNNTRLFGEYYGTSSTVPVITRTHIINYAGSTNKTLLTEGAGDKNGTGEVSRFVGLWRSTSAITSLTILRAGVSNQIAAGTILSLYGIKAA